MTTNEQHTPLTDEQLQAIRERVEKTTRGPWTVGDPLGIHTHNNVRAVLRPETNGGVSVALCRSPFIGKSAADATFIAAARKDVPALLDEVDRLRIENEALTLMGTGSAQMATGAYERLRQLQDENAQLLDIVRHVAKGPTLLGIATMYLCNFCDVYVGGIFGRTDHRVDCPITKARALLASDEVEG